MFDLDHRIRAYADYLEKTTPQVGAETAKQLARTRLRFGRLVPATAAAALLFLVIGLVALLQPFGSEEVPVVTEPPTMPTSITAPPTTITTAPPTTNATPETIAPIAGLLPVDVTWTPIETSVLGGPGWQEIEAITTGGPGFVAVGSESAASDAAPRRAPSRTPLPEGYFLRAAVWVSEDGTSWTRVAHDEAVFADQADVIMLDVTTGGPGVVAVGVLDRGAFGGNRFPDIVNFGEGDLDAMVWVSSDGIAWSRVPDDAGVLSGDGDQIIEAVVAAGPGLVAVGNEDGAATVWTSTDGYSWTRAALDDPPANHVWSAIHGIAHGGPGLIAVGTEFAEEGDSELCTEGSGVCRPRLGVHAAVWTSADGVAWDRVPHDPQIFGHIPASGSSFDLYMWEVVETDHGLVAAGWRASTRQQALWTSNDGLTWNLELSAETTYRHQSVPRALLTAGDEYVIAGWDPVTAFQPEPLGYPEARRFEPEYLATYNWQATRSITDIVTTGDRVLAVGWDGEDATVWSGEIER